MPLTRRVRLSSKGQIVIPKKMRDRLALERGDELVLHLVADHLLVGEPVGPSQFQRALTRLEARARKRPITAGDLERALEEARREDQTST